MSDLLRSTKFAAILSSMFVLVAAALLLLTFQNLESFSSSSPTVNAAHTSISHRLHIPFRAGLATNWAGYAAATNLSTPQPGSVSDAKASWTVPSLNCSDRRTAYSAMWTGIDGYTSSTVEQLGTEHDCYRGRASFFAWYEMYPDFMVTIPMTVKPGDQVSAEVKYQGTNQFLLTLQDGTQSFSITKTLQADRSSAEWIVEAPSSFNGTVLPLANFGTAHFNSSQATLNGHTGSPIDPAWQNDPLTMVTWFGAIKAYPSTVGSNGAFDVTWNHR